ATQKEAFFIVLMTMTANKKTAVWRSFCWRYSINQLPSGILLSLKAWVGSDIVGGDSPGEFVVTCRNVKLVERSRRSNVDVLFVLRISPNNRFVPAFQVEQTNTFECQFPEPFIFDVLQQGSTGRCHRIQATSSSQFV